MSAARRLRQVRSDNFGSIGAAKVPLPDGGNVPGLRITQMEVTYEKDFNTTPLWANGKWLVKKFPAKRSQDARFLFRTTGAGKAIVFATFEDANGETQFLFVRRVGKGDYSVTKQIPFATLPKFRIGVANKLDARIKTDFLSNKELKGITKNMLLITDTKEMYTTEALNGYGGLGWMPKDFKEKVDKMLAEKEGSTPHPGYVPAATGNKIKTLSGLNYLWNGSLSSHRWSKHGYSGKKEQGRDSAKGEAAVEGPWYVADYTGHFAFRGSTYLMRYDEQGNMLGYDAVEKLDRGMPAGVPICMVMQYFVHDPTGTAGLIAGGPDQLGWGVPSWKSVKKGASSVTKAVTSTAKKAADIVVDTAVDTGEAVGKFAEDPSWSNAAAIVTAPFGMNSCWHFANTVRFNRKSIFFVQDGLFTRANSITWPKDRKGLVTTFADSSAIPYRVEKNAKVHKDFKLDGKSYAKKDFAAKVEWYDTRTGKWSKPQAHPPQDLVSNSNGKIKLIFRFPRQLDPVADRQAIQSGIEAGFSDYSWTNNDIKTAYPFIARNPDTKKMEKKYYLLGRVEGKDSDTEARLTYEQTIDGKAFKGMRSLKFALLIKAPDHPRAGFSHDPAQGFMNTYEAFKVHVADPAKFTYIDNPEIDNSYYVDGELKPGSVVVVIGKGLGSVTGSNCIITTRGWTNIMEAQDLGRKDPPGDTPRHIYKSVIKPNNAEPRKVNDGSAAGTMRADYLEFAGHITADDLTDDKLVSGEVVLLNVWKRIFGKDLSAEWFSTTGKGLEAQNPDNPLHYIIKGDRGESYSFPYSIAWFKIPQYYVGPYLDYDDAGKLQTIAGKPFAIDSADKQVFVVAATPFGKIMQQKFDVVAETTEQKELAEAGVEKDAILAVNDMNYDAEDVTETVNLDERERDYLKRTGQTHPDDKPPRKYRYTDSWLKANFKFGNEDVVMKPRPTLAGFTNSSDFYVEDVTEKWGALSGNFENPYDEEHAMDAEGYSHGEQDPYLSFGAFGNIKDDAEDLVDSGTDWYEVGKNIGKFTGGGAGAFVASTVNAMDDAGLSTPEQIALGVGAFSVAAVAGVALVYLGPTSVVKAVRTAVTG